MVTLYVLSSVSLPALFARDARGPSCIKQREKLCDMETYFGGNILSQYCVIVETFNYDKGQACLRSFLITVCSVHVTCRMFRHVTQLDSAGFAVAQARSGKGQQDLHNTMTLLHPHLLLLLNHPSFLFLHHLLHQGELLGHGPAAASTCSTRHNLRNRR